MEKKILNKTLGRYATFIYSTYKTHIINKIKYDAVASPWKTIIVNPKHIQYWSSKFPISSNNGLGNINRGNWDSEDNLGTINSYFIVKGIKQRFEEGKDWIETDYVKNMQSEHFSKGESIWGCQNTEEFLQYRCRYVDNLYHDIKENGYSSETGSKTGENKKYDGRPKYKQKLEPLVLIGRDGEIILRDGYHRFAIAEILDLEIPVQVLGRHEQWQSIREQIQGPEPFSEYGYKTMEVHPDLIDIM